MTKYFMIAFTLGLMFSTTISSAEVFQTQSPIYTDEIGRSHFLGRGGYSSVRQIQMGEAQNAAVNEIQYKTKQEAMDKINEVNSTIQKAEDQAEKTVEDMKSFTSNEASKYQNADIDITSVIKEKPVIPASSHKSSFSYEKGKMDASLHGGYGGTAIPSGVNDSKTMYRDDLGRLHFFGKGNIIKE